jgi:myo-inositol-hexaphosphate 3-phosphohydrolase
MSLITCVVAVLELVDTSNNRVSFDNLTWTCYSAMATEDVNLKNSKLSIYPNPVTNNEFYISGIMKKETIQIYDLNGKLIQVVKNVGNKEKVNLTKLPKGVYIIKTQGKSTKIIVN